MADALFADQHAAIQAERQCKHHEAKPHEPEHHTSLASTRRRQAEELWKPEPEQPETNRGDDRERKVGGQVGAQRPVPALQVVVARPLPHGAHHAHSETHVEQLEEADGRTDQLPESKIVDAEHAQHNRREDNPHQERHNQTS